MTAYEREERRRSKLTRRVTRGFVPSALTAARETAGMSISDLARKSDVGETTLRRWENGGGTPQIDSLRTVLRVLEVEDLGTVVSVPHDERFPGDWRTLAKLTQFELADAAGINVAKLGRLERGETWPEDPGVTARIAAALNITVDDLRAAYARARNRPPQTPA